MNSTLNKVLIFALGAAVGSFVTWKYAKYKQEQEIEEVYEGDNEAEVSNDLYNNKSWSEIRDEMMSTLKGISSEEEYTPDPEGGIGTMRPYVISPDEYGEFDEYEQNSFTYYADGVLTDEWDDVIEDVDGVVGLESLTRFGEYEEDSVFVRNDRIRADIEILRDTRTFAEVNDDGPHIAEGE